MPYRIAVVASENYPAREARDVRDLVFLRQFTYTKIVIAGRRHRRQWKDVIWAISTRVDPKRDMTIIENTPIDYLDFASPGRTRLRLGIDATTKWPGEVNREFGRPIAMRPDVIERIDAIWNELGLG